jgi:hypothetical protein
MRGIWERFLPSVEMTTRAPFDFAQDMLCAFARDIPTFGCGSAALGLCVGLWMNGLQKPIGGNLFA